jgi:hypothetical protein
VHSLVGIVSTLCSRNALSRLALHQIDRVEIYSPQDARAVEVVIVEASERVLLQCQHRCNFQVVLRASTSGKRHGWQFGYGNGITIIRHLTPMINAALWFNRHAPIQN